MVCTYDIFYDRWRSCTISYAFGTLPDRIGAYRYIFAITSCDRLIISGAMQDFKLGGGGGGGSLKKHAPSRGRRENFWGISCEKSRFYQKIIFFPMAEGGAKNVGVFRVKNHDFTPKNLIFSNFRGGGGAGCAPPPPPWIRPCIYKVK